NYYFGGGGDTSVTPGALIILVVAIALIMVVSRRCVIVPLLVAGLLVPNAARVVVLGFHFPCLRFLLAAGWLRFALRRDIQAPEMNSIDKAVLCSTIFNAIAFSILWGTLGAVTNRLGGLWTTLGTYFLVRFLIRDKSDLIRVIKLLAAVMSIIAP